MNNETKSLNRLAELRLNGILNKAFDKNVSYEFLFIFVRQIKE